MQTKEIISKISNNLQKEGYLEDGFTTTNVIVAVKIQGDEVKDVESIKDLFFYKFDNYNQRPYWDFVFKIPEAEDVELFLQEEFQKFAEM